MAVKTYSIKFVSIEVASKSVPERPKSVDNAIQWKFNFRIDLKLSAEKKWALVVNDITLLQEETNIELAHFKIHCVFDFKDQTKDNFDDYFTKNEKENKYEVPEELEIVLKSAGISTSRGIIFSELEGTYLQGIILPLVDIASLVKKNIKKK